MTGSDYSIERIPESQIDPATDQEIRDLLCRCFPADAAVFARKRAWHDSVPHYSVISRHGDRMVGHIGIVKRTIRCGDTPVTVAGVQNMCVAPEHRGRGVSQELMARALDEATFAGIHLGLLFCIPQLEPLYRGMGWRKTDRTVTMLDEHGGRCPIPEINIAMIIQLGSEPPPDGPIDLAGRDW